MKKFIFKSLFTIICVIIFIWTVVVIVSIPLGVVELHGIHHELQVFNDSIQW